jgi:DNA-binding NarL/FixJ family response regulator
MDFTADCVMIVGKRFSVTTMTASIPPAANQDTPLVRVLIVDDMSQVLHDLRLLLELSGLIQIVAEAGNGLDAVHKAEELHPEVIIMDLEMPVMDGYEATRQIKARQLAQRVVILSVHAGEDEVERAKAAGADGFVIKGASYDVLLDAILAKGGSFDSINFKKG